LLDGDKFDAALKELAGKGVQVDGPEDTGIAYSAFLNDADGNLLEFTTYDPPPPRHRLHHLRQHRQHAISAQDE
jgi:hypothetical protein